MMDYADEYAAVDRDHWWFAGRRVAIQAALRRYLPSGSRLLDVGCGTGGLSAELAQRYRVTGADPSPAAVAIARRRGIDAIEMQAGQPLPGGFDAACAFDVLEHVDDDVQLARQLAGAVRPDGIVAVTVPAYRSLWSAMDELGGHRRRYRLRQLGGVMAAAGIRRVHASYFNALLFPALVAGHLMGLPQKGHELEPPPKPLNRLLSSIFRAESAASARLTIPFGGSILFLGRRAGRVGRQTETV
jgi:SAM-dependent methyltransferase